MPLFGRSREEQEEWAANEVALGVQCAQGDGISVTNAALNQAVQHFQAALKVFTPSAYPQQAAEVRRMLALVQETLSRREQFLGEAAKRFGWSQEEVERARRMADRESSY